jgi:hypothetical protein
MAVSARVTPSSRILDDHVRQDNFEGRNETKTLLFNCCRMATGRDHRKVKGPSAPIHSPVGKPFPAEARNDRGQTSPDVSMSCAELKQKLDEKPWRRQNLEAMMSVGHCIRSFYKSDCRDNEKSKLAMLAYREFRVSN